MSKLLTRFGIWVFKWLPFSVVHVLSDALAFVLRVVLRYRKKVITQNLIGSFPDKSITEIRSIRLQFYRNLADNFLETLKSYSMTEDDLRRRMTFSNTALLDGYFDQGQSVLIVGGHFYSWELGVQGVALWLKHVIIGIFKPLSNPKVESYINTKRNRFGTELVSMNQSVRAIAKNRNRTCAFVLIADQGPSNTRSAHWVPFLNRETGFLQGMDKLARSTGYPVIYYELTKKTRGHYNIHFEMLCDHPKEKDEQELTRLFADRLAQSIHDDPPGWLWSHRRWKRSRAEIK